MGGLILILLTISTILKIVRRNTIRDRHNNRPVVDYKKDTPVAYYYQVYGGVLPIVIALFLPIGVNLNFWSYNEANNFNGYTFIVGIVFLIITIIKMLRNKSYGFENFSDLYTDAFLLMTVVAIASMMV